MMSSLSRPLALAAAVLFGGCGDAGSPTTTSAEPSAREGPAPTVHHVVVASGNGQQTLATQPLESPLVLRVTSGGQQPVADAAVTWRVAEGGGTLTSASARTDAGGYAVAYLRLGPHPGPNAVVAAVSGTSVTFQATATPLPPPGTATAILKLYGDAQAARPGDVLTQVLSARVVDAAGNGVPGMPVRWTASSGGSLAPYTATTNPLGYANARWTLGAAAGTQTATASVDGLAPALFTAQAVPGLPRPPVEVVYLGLGDTFLEPGLTSAATAAALDGAGLRVRTAEITWAVADPALVSLKVTQSGEGFSRVEFTGLVPGETTITATAAGKSNTFRVRVYPPGQKPRGGDGCGGCG